MNNLIKLNSDNEIDFYSWINQARELVKSTLVCFQLKKNIIGTEMFSRRFSADYLPEANNLDNISYKEIFTGKRAKDLISVYTNLIEIWKEIQEMNLPFTFNENQNYSSIINQFKKLDKQLDLLVEKYNDKQIFRHS
ncbi:MAG: hypothetical protein WC264_04050 [Candidatus Paceibacterota bacterium]|jgi:hypothetical protein